MKRLTVCFIASLGLGGCRTAWVEAEPPQALLERYSHVDKPNFEMLPSEGQWAYDEVKLVSSDCGILEELIPIEQGGSFKVKNAAQERFAVHLDAVDEETACWMTGEDFSCDTLYAQSSVPEYDTTLDVGFSALGSLHSETEKEGLYEVDIDCSGSGCPLAETAYKIAFPCYMAIRYTATFQ